MSDPPCEGFSYTDGCPGHPHQEGQATRGFDGERMLEVVKRRTPTKWFWCDMTDMFGSWVADEWLDRMFAVMTLTPQHTHQILTKRPERMRAYMSDPETPKRISEYMNVGTILAGGARSVEVSDMVAWAKHGVPWPLPNVWLGVSVEDQATADQRIPLLLQTPAAVRWVSYEPALAGVDFTDIVVGRGSGSEHHINALSMEDDDVRDDEEYSGACLDWVVVGGESGPKARLCDVAWIRSTVEQCKASGVPVFVKQLGAIPVMGSAQWRAASDAGPAPLLGYRNAKKVAEGFEALAQCDRKGGDPAEWPADLRVREFPAVRS